MATKTRIKFIDAGFRAILQSPGTRAAVENAANQIQARAGANFKTTVKMGGYGGGRWIAFVSAANYAGRYEEAVGKVLTWAVGA